jgi:plastocyanin
MSYAEQEARRRNRKRVVTLIITGVIIIAIILVAAVVMARRGTNGKPVTISDAVAHVTVESGGLTPSTVKVKKGQQIVWTNNDVTPHHLTADQSELPSFDTPEPLEQGDSYAYIFDKVGTYRYYDAADPQRLQGTVTVE